jgi:hypothetical protein
MATSQPVHDAWAGHLSEPLEWYLLWGIALLTYGVGDGLSTIAILSTPGVVETNVLIRWLVGMYGHAGLIGLKLTVFFVCLGVSLYGSRIERDAVLYYAPMVLLTVVGVFTTAVNIGLLWA